ncbi:hypothetical protein BSL84_20510 [Streptomyces sp. TN58]|nr:hypothetical protein BSL84_20510 [Streptomyces sp. TN58]
MAPAQPPTGPRRWDAQAQRWVVDKGPAGPAAVPPAGPQAGPPPGTVPGLPPRPPQPPNAPTAPTVPTAPYGPPAVPPPPGPGPADRPRGRWVTPATAGIAVASVAIGAAAVWFVARDTGDADHAGEKNGTVTSGAPTESGDGTATATGTPTAGQSTGAGPSRTPTPSPTGTGPGAGAHETKQDPAGFTIAVPAGWVREEIKEGVFYRSADRSALIQVFRVSEPELTPLKAVQQASTYLRGGTRGYEEISVGPVPGSSDAAELVYQYDSEESRGVRRGVERVFVAADGGKWAVLTAGPVADWQATQDHHAAALAAFRPTG